MVVPAAQLDVERSGASGPLRLDGAGGPGPGLDRAGGPAAGDRVALIADTRPQVLFGLGRVTPVGAVRYERRLFDAPVPVAVPVPPGVSELTPAGYASLIPAVTRFLVSVSLPIEA